ncbi:DUF742 domain-containing protein [Nocardiopsis ansamitocini]|uniref:DUF742 domain-containing protein n=1 Tax=Nocardiopsis ansamitocini TaxID=1670832 RepID=A0A9W6P654_9ACTN|nr:DUF742 domain-containing protein [Nocardiopsis ansamitocini]GLU48149.1 hypothetical protein Nans01_25000 [Nocardiopsis ansamitocini]
MSGPGGFDPGPGRLLRPFAVVANSPGRIRTPRLDLAALLVATRTPRHGDELRPEQEQILRLCATPRSVAELAAALAMPTNLTRLLAVDMLATGSLRQCDTSYEGKDVILAAVLEGLRAL